MTAQNQQNERPTHSQNSEGPTESLNRIESLAREHAKANADIPGIALLRQIKKLKEFLEKAHQTLALPVPDEVIETSQAAEWILDNYFVVQQAFRQIEEDLPANFYRELPKLSEGKLRGTARVFLVARAILQDHLTQITSLTVQEWLDEYQNVQPLSMGELWALPIMLRVSALDTLAGALAIALEVNPPQLEPALELGNDPDVDSVVMFCVLNLRTIANIDWKEFFEDVSLVERILSGDPARVYARMDFETRNRYRGAIESLAKSCRMDELEVSQQVIELASHPQSQDASEQSQKSRHVGYFLIDEGLKTLEGTLHFRPSSSQKMQRWFFEAHPTLTYLASIGLLGFLMLVLLLIYGIQAGATTAQRIGLVLLLIVPSLTVATNLVNWILTILSKPRVLPKMDYNPGIPAAARTMVVMPTLLANQDDVDSLLNRLELHYLQNIDPHITFGLLTDFSDSPEQHQPEDEGILDYAIQRVQDLNNRYPHEPFYLFHRERLWNPAENTWMGWERKRGKLEEFNQLLRGDQETSYILSLGDLSILREVQYVITLDSDTMLPRGAAQELIGTLDHLLNRAEFAGESNRLVKGYAVLQPRIETKPAIANLSRFTRIYAGPSGLDLYSHAVSDVYQDLFGEGIFVGKGIYDVDAFRRALDQRTPENAILSHDLFEGIHSRAGLVTDIILYEGFPENFRSYALRQHRWIRGDWQLLPWLLPRVPQRGNRTIGNSLSRINIWKMADNIRRSLVAPALLVLLMAGWLWLPGSAGVWTLTALLTMTLALISTTFVRILRQSGEEGFSRETWVEFRNQFYRELVFFALLPYETYVAVDAIITVLIRLLITRKGLLQWTTMAEVGSALDNRRSLGIIWREMLGVSFFSVGIGLLLFLFKPAILLLALPLLLVWLLSPLLVYFLDQPTSAKKPRLKEEDYQLLRSLARHTWLYFEEFIGPGDNWLPPDHFQEHPGGQIAHSTSPTNIGLGFLASVSAFDLGYISVDDLALRLRNSIDSLNTLEKYRGHFLNWYDTRTRTPLPPRYVSTVDSGNLAANLIVLEQVCAEVIHKSLPHRERMQGLVDTLQMLVDQIPVQERQANAGKAVQAEIREIQQELLATAEKPAKWGAVLSHLAEVSWPSVQKRLVEMLENRTLQPEVISGIRVWNERVSNFLSDMVRLMDLVLPWQSMLRNLPELIEDQTLPIDVLQKWADLCAVFPMRVTLSESPALHAQARSRLSDFRRSLARLHVAEDRKKVVEEWCDEFTLRLDHAKNHAITLLEMYRAIGEKSAEILQEMSFGFLYDAHRRLFYIGYNVDTETPDQSYYDLLASEARSASLIAISKGEVPQEHWLHLGRPITRVNGYFSLVSWSGTMFEFLMPNLWIRQYENTLLYESGLAAVSAQKEYARQKGVPWGMSESAFYRLDPAGNYLYRAFGLSNLAFKQGLENDLVIAPYASLLALDIDPKAVLENLHALRKMDMWGDYGLYDAVDFTPSRLTLGQDFARVRTFMVHHQGMILLALNNFLEGEKMVERFHATAWVRSVELLLQERIPNQVTLEKEEAARMEAFQVKKGEPRNLSWSVPIHTPTPQGHYLSNGDYGVLLTNAGGGYSHWAGTDLTRWRADSTRDDWGTWMYVTDLENGETWSVATQPVAGENIERSVYFSQNKVDYIAQTHDLVVLSEVIVHPSDDLEIRRVTLTNQSGARRRFRLTSYGEIVLSQQENDRRHPVFNKLFIESQFLPQQHAILFKRRLRAAGEATTTMAHAVVGEANANLEVTFESDRKRFLGRGGNPRQPKRLSLEQELPEGSSGAVLDPVMSLSATIELAPHSTTSLAFLTLAGKNQETVEKLIQKFREWGNINQAFSISAFQAEEAVKRLNLDSDDLKNYSQLLSLLLYPSNVLRADAATLSANQKSQPGLWAHAISGDYPILLVQIYDQEDLLFVRRILRFFNYWRNRGIKVDLVFMNERPGGYAQRLQGQLMRLIHRLNTDQWIGQRGGIFILQRSSLTTQDSDLFATVARAILDAKAGSLSVQLQKIWEQPALLPGFFASSELFKEPALPAVTMPEGLLFENSWGGFNADGSEYQIYLQRNEPTPAPWINVIANPSFGFLVSESGSGFTWSENSGENRLTPWNNDPVLDKPGEVLYLRDEEAAQVWTPTPEPRGASSAYRIRHGAGYSVFENNSHGLIQQLEVFAAPQDPVKIIRLRLKNAWERERRITATYYAEWVLGVNREATQTFLVLEYDPANNALLVRNPYSIEFGERVAFLSSNRPLHGLTTDRTEFIGSLGDLHDPAALSRVGLSGTVSPGLDPCAALQVHIDLKIGEEQEIIFILGQAADREEALQLVERFRKPEQAEAAWEQVLVGWDDLLGTVQVETPEPAMNILLNRWLAYQNLSCRIWGRSAFYQSGGAFGFRDQLQDVLAMLLLDPGTAREQILRAARHQFKEGDVLHWWHPPLGRGVRTRISDDLLWLPYVTTHYLKVTGDQAILEEKIPFLTGDLLKNGEHERYDLFGSTRESATLYEHCWRAIEKGATSGPHGLPLIGGGDWNDGMNRVGIQGQGESIWLGWFLYATLQAFKPLAESRGDLSRLRWMEQTAERLKQVLNSVGWDGDWYLRAFYDNGSPLGSHNNQECQIDSIAQSWAVLSGAGGEQQSRQALEALWERLVREEEQLLLLFTPPFDQTPRDPGYIKGYPPGVRENGGQYTHAAIWAAWAFASLGQGERAGQLFRLLNPILHADLREKASCYQREPYVVTADIYSTEPHTGLGGWSWYTGSGGWLYRLGVEAILGLVKEGENLRMNPCIPRDWHAYSLRYRFGATIYQIRVENPQGVNRGVVRLSLDGQDLPDQMVQLVDDGSDHQVLVVLG